MSILSLAKKAVREECENTEFYAPYYALCKTVEKIDPNCPYYDEIIENKLYELIKDWEIRGNREEYIEALKWALNSGREYEYI